MSQDTEELFERHCGDKTNTLLAAAAYNMMKWMRLKRQEIWNFNFSLDLPDPYFGSGKYPTLENKQ